MSSLILDGFSAWVEGLLARVATQVLQQMLGVLLDATTRVSFTSGWWTEPSAQEVLRLVLALSAALMVGCLLLALLQGLLAGDPGSVLRAVVIEAPVSVLGIVVLTAVAAALLDFTDAASGAVFGDGSEISRAVGNLTRPGGGALNGLLLALVALGGFLLWAQLVLREALIYLLVAVAPLLLAARVWPTARSAWNKAVEVGLALILSEFPIALALRLGAAAVNGGVEDGIDPAGVLGGGVLLLTAAFMPFTLLRLFDVVQAAAVAQGVTGAPARSAMQAMQYGYYLRSGGAGALLGAGRAAARPAPPVAAAATAGSAPPVPSARRAHGPAPRPTPLPLPPAPHRRAT